jgi:hypothetical protein
LNFLSKLLFKSQPQPKVPTTEEILFEKINKCLYRGFMMFNSKNITELDAVYCNDLLIFKIISPELIPKLFKLNISGPTYITKEMISYIPDTITHLNFRYGHNTYSGDIDDDTTENNCNNCESDILDYLSSNVIWLSIPAHYCGTLNNLPQGLKFLELSATYNKSIEKLPEGLETLVLGHCFNKSIENLPNSIINITIPINYNYKLDYLPDSIEYIKIGIYDDDDSNNGNSFFKDLDYCDQNKIFKINKLPKSLINIDSHHSVKLLLEPYFELPINYRFNVKKNRYQ